MDVATAPTAEHKLEALRWHWDTAFDVDFDGETWLAIPHADRSQILTAATAMGLLQKMRDDYGLRTRRRRLRVVRSEPAQPRRFA